MEWISVEDRVPTVREDVLCYCSGAYQDGTPHITQASRGEGGEIWRDTFEWAMHDVTHWMPLPKPPGESK